jgi:hypothetical protein
MSCGRVTHTLSYPVCQIIYSLLGVHSRLWTRHVFRYLVLGIYKSDMTGDIPHTYIAHLRGSQIFHFLGHSNSDYKDPSQSTLLLQDRETNRLSVGDLPALSLRISLLVGLEKIARKDYYARELVRSMSIIRISL